MLRHPANLRHPAKALLAPLLLLAGMEHLSAAPKVVVTIKPVAQAAPHKVIKAPLVPKE